MTAVIPNYAKEPKISGKGAQLVEFLYPCDFLLSPDIHAAALELIHDDRFSIPAIDFILIAKNNGTRELIQSALRRTIAPSRKSLSDDHIKALGRATHVELVRLREELRYTAGTHRMWSTTNTEQSLLQEKRGMPQWLLPNVVKYHWPPRSRWSKPVVLAWGDGKIQDGNICADKPWIKQTVQYQSLIHLWSFSRQTNW
jgi:hypothetical protein